MREGKEILKQAGEKNKARKKVYNIGVSPNAYSNAY
jgi:hypothetical protein